MSPDDRPRELVIAGKRLVDVRHLFPTDGSAGRRRDIARVIGVAVHHDGVLMAPGDRNYSGGTLDEDIQRLYAIYNRGLQAGWGGFPYHLVASPNGRLFLCLDLSCFGAHVAQRNHELLGVSLMGNFMLEAPSTTQLCAAGLAVAVCWRDPFSPGAVEAHYQWARPTWPTSCPGDTWPIWGPRLDQFAQLHDRSMAGAP